MRNNVLNIHDREHLLHLSLSDVVHETLYLSTVYNTSWCPYRRQGPVAQEELRLKLSVLPERVSTVGARIGFLSSIFLGRFFYVVGYLLPPALTTTSFSFQKISPFNNERTGGAKQNVSGVGLVRGVRLEVKLGLYSAT